MAVINKGFCSCTCESFKAKFIRCLYFTVHILSGLKPVMPNIKALIYCINYIFFIFIYIFVLAMTVAMEEPTQTPDEKRLTWQSSNGRRAEKKVANKTGNQITVLLGDMSHETCYNRWTFIVNKC